MDEWEEEKEIKMAEIDEIKSNSGSNEREKYCKKITMKIDERELEVKGKREKKPYQEMKEKVLCKWERNMSAKKREKNSRED